MSTATATRYHAHETITGLAHQILDLDFSASPADCAHAVRKLAREMIMCTYHVTEEDFNA